ncbi:MAG: hypothetical protein MGG37_17340 [Trichodesmium sp. MAG_R01]|nr:hypothetical protein [Trichodesmium sp. MAG_R01]
MVQTDKSNVRVNFRVVGIYCFITGYTLGELEVTSGDNIQTVQNAVKSKYNHENGLGAYDSDRFEIFEDTSQDNVLTGFAYTFRPDSQQPFDASPRVEPGRRELREQGLDYGATKLVWQYYVSANLERDSKKIIVARDPRPRNDGEGDIQPKYHLTSLDQDLPITDLKEYELKAYNIIWRLLAINISPEGIKMRERRRPTSGRIV